MTNSNAVNYANSARSRARDAESLAQTPYDRAVAEALVKLAQAVAAIGQRQD